MRLTELEPTFLIRDDDHHFHMTDNIQEADGVEFLCPVCLGTHAIICWSPQVPQTTSPTPGRWNMQGSGYNDLTLVAGSSSILLQGAPCGAHFFIRNGDICRCQ